MFDIETYESLHIFFKMTHYRTSNKPEKKGEMIPFFGIRKLDYDDFYAIAATFIVYKKEINERHMLLESDSVPTEFKPLVRATDALTVIANSANASYRGLMEFTGDSHFLEDNWFNLKEKMNFIKCVKQMAQLMHSMIPLLIQYDYYLGAQVDEHQDKVIMESTGINLIRNGI